MSIEFRGEGSEVRIKKKASLFSGDKSPLYDNYERNAEGSVPYECFWNDEVIVPYFGVG